MNSLNVKEFWDKLKEGIAKQVDEVAEGKGKAENDIAIESAKK